MGTWQQENREWKNEYNRNWYKNNLEKVKKYRIAKALKAKIKLINSLKSSLKNDNDKEKTK